MIVYLLTMTAVFDQGACGIFFERTSAERHAANLHAVSDGHHQFRIDEMELDVGYLPHGTLKLSSYTGTPSQPATITMEELDHQEVFGDDASTDFCSCDHIRMYHHVTETAPSTRSVECTYGDCTCIVWDPV